MAGECKRARRRLGESMDLSNHALLGAVVFILFVASTLGQLSLERVPGRWALPGGCLILVAGAGFGVSVGAASFTLLTSEPRPSLNIRRRI